MSNNKTIISSDNNKDVNKKVDDNKVYDKKPSSSSVTDKQRIASLKKQKKEYKQQKRESEALRFRMQEQINEISRNLVIALKSIAEKNYTIYMDMETLEKKLSEVYKGIQIPINLFEDFKNKLIIPVYNIEVNNLRAKQKENENKDKENETKNK